MSEMSSRLRLIIQEKYKSEAECARRLGWTRQRFSKIVNALKEPDVSEVEQIAIVLGRSITEIADIFLLAWSTNG